MATLHLICGLPCAGKTTFARQLEQTHQALRFTPDEWHIRLFGMDFAEDEPLHDARHNLIETMQWELAARALTLGLNVIRPLAKVREKSAVFREFRYLCKRSIGGSGRESDFD